MAIDLPESSDGVGQKGRNLEVFEANLRKIDELTKFLESNASGDGNAPGYDLTVAVSQPVRVTGVARTADEAEGSTEA